LVENLTQWWGIFLDLLSAVPTTLALVACGVLLGLVLALGLVMMRLSQNFVLRYFAKGWIFFFRGTPLLVQLFLVYYGLPQFDFIRHNEVLWPLFREPFFCGFLTLALNTSAYTAEIMRGAVQSIPHGQVEAALAAGMSRLTRLRRIIIPQAVRHGLPAYGNEIILLVKGSALVSIITVTEMTLVAYRINSRTFDPVTTFTIAGLIYLAINTILIQIIRFTEWKLSPERRAAPSMQEVMTPTAPGAAAGK